MFEDCTNIDYSTDSGATTAEYGAGETFAITEDTTLYAIYTIGTDVLRKVGAGGGWVFYDAGSAQSWGRYLEAAPQSTEWALKEWGKHGTLVSGTGTAIGTGKAKTDLIVAKLNEAPADSDRAAQLADALSHGGYEDWFLPSKDELNAIWTNLVDDGSGSNSGVGGFVDENYWSSSENDSNHAWVQYFDDGSQYSNDKTNGNRVRAVRAF